MKLSDMKFFMELGVAINEECCQECKWKLLERIMKMKID